MHTHLGYFQQSAETDAETKYSHVGNEAFQQHAYSGVQKPRVESKQGVRSPVIISLVFRIPIWGHHYRYFPPASAENSLKLEVKKLSTQRQHFC
jgi:hypothetical protein